MTLSELTEWLVLNGWPRVDLTKADRDSYAEGRNEPHWILVDDLKPQTLFIVPDGTRPYWASVSFDEQGQHRELCFGTCTSGRTFATIRGDIRPALLPPLLEKLASMDPDAIA